MNCQVSVSRTFLFFAITFVSLGILLSPQSVYAGVYDANSPVTYKEYWVPHSEYDGNCPPDGTEWYIEPASSCTRTLEFTILDNFASAIKAEIYIDLWRNHNERTMRFQLNSGPLRTPNVGSDWSRTPYITEIPLTELKQGVNTIFFTNDGSSRRGHVHDVAIRIYYDDSNPLTPGINSDVTPPSGLLTSITADNGTFAPGDGGTLQVDSDQLTLSAVVTETAMVEFHAFYEGQDLDNDGKFRDWQNRTRHNCHPGGSTSNGGCTGAKPAVGGTVDHIGTTGPAGSFSNCSWSGGTNTASCTWDLSQVINQSGVRFKIRILDADGNVVDAAGGDSAQFALVRNNPTAAFINPDFEDAVLHHDGLFDDVYTTTVELPSNVSGYNVAYLLGSYFGNPTVEVNGRSVPRPFVQGSNSPDADTWTLSEIEVQTNRIRAGTNSIQYIHPNPNLFGEFIEHPGPMIILRRTGDSFTDATPPSASGIEPASGSVDVDRNQTFVAYISDDYGVGVDYTSIKMTVNNVAVNPKISGFSNQYKLTYTESGGFTNNAQIVVKIDAKDLKGNVMPQVVVSFTIEAPDFSPPVVSNLQVIPGFTQATISWETDEPAISTINFGTTTTYTGTVTDSEYKLLHEMTIPNLNPDEEYHYSITSEDTDANSGATTDATFRTQSLLPVVSDDFNYCNVNDPRWAKWEFIDPRGDSSFALDGQHLTISVPGGIEHDIWDNDTPIIRAPHLLQNATDPNLTIAKFATGVGTGIQQQGILAIQDANNLIRVNFQYNNGETQVVMVRVRDGDARVVKSATVISGPTTGPLYLSISRDAQNRWRPRYSLDGNVWNSFGTITQFFTITKVGVYAGNAPENGVVPAMDAVVDYFFNDASPIQNEDGIPQGLPVSANPVEGGTVLKDVECGNPVTLTAIPNPGWLFDSWGGNVSGTENPKSVAFGQGDVVIANFVRESYTVTTGTVGNGGITKVPDQATYIYSDTVTLTATADSGWFFTGWSGDASGTDNPLALLVDDNKTITATFEPGFNLTVALSDPAAGSVTKAPEKLGYATNEEVTVTAIPTVGWEFVGWSGDANGNENPLVVTMTADKSLTALFAQEEYTLTLNVSDPAGGTVVPTPLQATYTYSTAVTVVATANPGWTFAGWSGDATGTENPLLITMDGDKTLTAIFTQEMYTVMTNVAGNGMVNRNPDQITYLYNDQVTLQAETTEPGWEFERWEGDVTGSLNPVTLTIDGSKMVTAVFTRTQYMVQAQIAAGQGSVDISPEGPYYYGDQVVVTAIPAAEWTLDNWSGDATGSDNPLELTINGNKSLLATFVEAAYALTTTVTGNGTIQRSPDLQSFKSGDNVELTAVPAAGWQFTGWSGAVIGVTNPISPTMDSDKTVNATFERLAYIVNLNITSTISNTDPVSNTVSMSPALNTYNFGDIITLTPVTADGWTFAGWAGDLSGSTAPAQLTVTGDMTVTALFTPTFYEISFSIFGQDDAAGSVEASPPGPYMHGQKVTLTATPKEGYIFNSWQIEDAQASLANQNDPVLTITIPDTRIFRARFVKTEQQIFLPIVVR